MDLDPSTIAALLAADAKKPARTGGGKVKRDSTEPRTYQVWWQQETNFGNCDNQDCTDTREALVAEGKQMVAFIKEQRVCRYCFLVGYLSDGS